MRIHDLLHSIKGLFGGKKNDEPRIRPKASPALRAAPEPVPTAKPAPPPPEPTAAPPKAPERKPVVNRKPNNATYVKLQALSASGTGTSLTTGDQSEALGALLERLDKDK